MRDQAPARSGGFHALRDVLAVSMGRVSLDTSTPNRNSVKRPRGSEPDYSVTLAMQKRASPKTDRFHFSVTIKFTEQPESGSSTDDLFALFNEALAFLWKMRTSYKEVTLNDFEYALTDPLTRVIQLSNTFRPDEEARNALKKKNTYTVDLSDTLYSFDINNVMFQSYKTVYESFMGGFNIPTDDGRGHWLSEYVRHPEKLTPLVMYSMNRTIQMLIEGGRDPLLSDDSNRLVGLDGLVICSYQQNVILETLKSTIPQSRVRWWKNFVDRVAQTFVGKGSFNTVSTVDCADAQLDDTFWTTHYPDIQYDADGLPTKLVIRKGTNIHNAEHRTDTQERQKVADEILLQCYCASFGIGPRVFAAFYTDDEFESSSLSHLSEASANVPTHDYVTENVLKDYLPVESMCSVSELWTGSLGWLFDGERGSRRRAVYESKNFAIKLVAVIHFAATKGIFHGDIKPKNMLFDVKSKSAGGEWDVSTLKVCLTDFDPRFCIFIPPQERNAGVIRCTATAMVALFLGFLKCLRRHTYNRIQANVQAAFVELLGPLPSPSLSDTCNFLKATRTIADLGPGVPPKTFLDFEKGISDELLEVSNTFQQMVAQYSSAKKPNDKADEDTKECFKLDAERPLFQQFLEYCFTQAPQTANRPSV